MLLLLTLNPYDAFKPLTLIFYALNDLSVGTSACTRLPPFQSSQASRTTAPNVIILIRYDQNPNSQTQ